jgi:HEPN domain-containing protein
MKVKYRGVVVGEIEPTGDTQQDAEAARQLLVSKGLYKETSDFELTLHQAVAFAHTAKLLYERGLYDPEHVANSTAPFIVNAAFSIELHLKALAQKHGTTNRGHELLTLYADLPQKAQAEIEQVSQRYFATKITGERPGFFACLQDLNHAFVKWRYIHERRETASAHIEQAVFALEILNEACHLPAD